MVTYYEHCERLWSKLVILSARKTKAGMQPAERDLLKDTKRKE